MDSDNLPYPNRLKLALDVAVRYRNTALSDEEIDGIILDIADEYDVDDSDITNFLFGE